MRVHVRDALARLTPSTVLLIGWALFLVYAYPGYMSTDSVVQLTQARAGHYTDWHPPLMAFEWRIVELFVTGPLGMLLVQSALLLWGAYLLLRHIASARAAAWAAVAIFLFPPVATTMAVIWKDSQMAGYLVMGMALILSASRRVRVVGYAMLLVACAMRYNAPAAILPLLLLAFWRWTRPRWQRITAAALATIALFAGSTVINRWLTDEHEYPWHSSMALFDLAGTIRDGGPQSDAAIREELDGVPLAVHDDLYAKIYAQYDPRNYWFLCHGDARIFDLPTNAAQRDAIVRAWKRVVLGDPSAYFHHRRRVFYHLLGAKAGDEHLWSPAYHALSENPDVLPGLHHDAKPSAIQEWLYRRLDAHQDGILFRPYMYFWASILALILCAILRRGVEVALIASGLCYELTYLFLAPTPDNRYSHWMFTCITLAAAVSLLTASRWAYRTS